jgi:hypothetical protein
MTEPGVQKARAKRAATKGIGEYSEAAEGNVHGSRLIRAMQKFISDI